MVKTKLMDKNAFAGTNLGFDELLMNEGGKTRKFLREKKIKELISEKFFPNDKTVDLIKIYLFLTTTRNQLINLSDLTKNK